MTIEIPLPTPQDVIISAELLFLLWPLRWLQREAEMEAIKAQRQLHKKSHSTVARFCSEDSCKPVTIPRSSTRPQLPVLAPDLILELDQVDLML